MKTVILRCEDGAGGERTTPLLEGAKTPHLQHLAQAGAAGTIQVASDPAALDRVRLHRMLLGLDAEDPDAGPGRWYAANANLTLEPAETVWCCELVTQRDGRILDPEAGRIPTKESTLLIQALDEQLGSDARRWEVGQGPHHLFITHDPALEPEGAAIRSPELAAGHPWERHLPKGRLGEALRALITQASAILDEHPVNRVRVDLGENPANLLWFWGGSGMGPVRTFTDRTGSSGAVVSSSFLLRGLARALALDWHDGPQTFTEAALERTRKAVETALGRHDLVYVHLRIRAMDPVERLVAMERIDRILLRPLTEWLPGLGPWRLAAVVDARNPRWVPVIAIGTGLPQQPIAQLDAASLSESPLSFKDGAGLSAWLGAAPASPATAP